MAQVNRILFSVNVEFISLNKSEISLTEDELKLVWTNYLNDNLTLPDFFIQGEVNGKNFDIKTDFDRTKTLLNSIIIQSNNEI